ncbi:DMT family transporter [Aquincola sp. J276]|uniref:DMT family transporter n=1 Tax=Aquincola sp. J276 TaxID=2898432 RepID=UPI0021508C7A|nr:DMT family transporter [Aquincola sp. J276]
MSTALPILPRPTPITGAAATRAARRGWWLGLAGVLMFALSIPMTRLAGGDAAQPQLPPDFVAIGRAAVAGLLSVLYLAATGAPRPRGAQWGLLAVSAAGVVFGFPWFSGFAVRHVEAIHASVINGFLPLATAVVGALWLRQRPAPAFWLCALLGCGLVLAFAVVQGGGRLQAADGLLLAAVASGAVGYVGGARLAAQGMRGEHVICWMLVLCLPLTLPWALAIGLRHPEALAAARPAAWGGFAYVSLVSMWLGFFAWYRGLALGGTLRVSQVQLVQPFASMLVAVPLLGERLDGVTVLFALAVIATVLVGKRVPVAPSTSPEPSR